jgi:hypothetical protein
MTARHPMSLGLATVCVAVVTSALIALSFAERPSTADPQVLLREARGAVAIDQSRAGRAIVKGDNLRPGSVVRGETVVENSGTARARITLRSKELHSSTGPNDVAFTDVLQLRVRRRTPKNKHSGPKTLYEGMLGGMKALDLRVWRPGVSHTYTFRVAFPDGNGDAALNAWQRSSASLGFIWTASQAH